MTPKLLTLAGQAFVLRAFGEANDVCIIVGCGFDDRIEAHANTPSRSQDDKAYRFPDVLITIQF